jgi:hypothetical protein
MNLQAATDIGGQFRGMARQSGGQYNANDLINLTNVAAETGLLSGATNTQQIMDSIKGLLGLVGKMAKLTGDPDFRSNVRELANMRSAGFELSAIPGATANMNMFARMAGVTRSQLMEGGGSQGAAMFGQLGLGTGVGMMVGGHSAAMARMTGGAFDPRLENLLGGQQGITQRLTAGAGAFLQGAAGSMLLPALVGQAGGGVAIDPARVKEMLSGNMDLGNMIGGGAARMNPQLMQQILTRKPELLTQLGEQLGPAGLQMAQFRMIQGMQKQMGGEKNVSFEAAATMFSGGDALQGRMMTNMYMSQDWRDRSRAQIEETRRQLVSEARGETAARIEARPNWLGRGTRSLGDLARGSDEQLRTTRRGLEARGFEFGTGDDERRAEMIARKQQQHEDEALGIRRVYGPNWKLSQREQAYADKLQKSGADTSLFDQSDEAYEEAYYRMEGSGTAGRAAGGIVSAVEGLFGSGRSSRATAGRTMAGGLRQDLATATAEVLKYKTPEQWLKKYAKNHQRHGR